MSARGPYQTKTDHPTRSLAAQVERSAADNDQPHDQSASGGQPTVTVRALLRRIYGGVRVEIDQDRSHARIDVGTVPSWELVGLVDQRIAPAVVGCACIEVVGERADALSFLLGELRRLLPVVDDWLADSDHRRGAA